MGQIVGPRGLGWSSGSVFRRFLGASGVPPGALLATFFGFSRHDFSAKFRIRFWRVFSRFRVAFGLLRASFSRAFGGYRLWQKRYPRPHGSYVFDVLSGQKQGFFRHRFRRGSRRRFLRLFGVFWAPLGTRRLHFGHHGALISRTDFEEILGAKMMDFWDLPQTREIVQVIRVASRAKRKSILAMILGTVLRGT